MNFADVFNRLALLDIMITIENMMTHITILYLGYFVVFTLIDRPNLIFKPSSTTLLQIFVYVTCPNGSCSRGLSPYRVMSLF